MKLTRYILGIAGAAVLLSGCEELEKAQAYAPDSDMIIAPVLSKLPPCKRISLLSRTILCMCYRTIYYIFDKR